MKRATALEEKGSIPTFEQLEPRLLLDGLSGDWHSAYGDLVQESNPVLYWRLDEASKAASQAVIDSGGLGQDGIYGGSVLDVRDTVFGSGGAARFGDPADGEDAAKLQPLSFPSTAFTIEFWLRADDFTHDQIGILSYAYTDNYNELYVRAHSDGQLDVQINYTGSTLTDVLDSADILDNEWHYIALTWESDTGDFNAYLDGEHVSQNIFKKNGVIHAGGALVLGQEQDSVGGKFASSQRLVGDLDEVAIYDKVLDADTIRSHFQLIDPGTDDDTLVLRRYSNDGYSFFSLIRASAVVNRQFTLLSAPSRATFHAFTSRRNTPTSSIRRDKHCRLRMPNSISAMSNQLPCFGV